MNHVFGRGIPGKSPAFQFSVQHFRSFLRTFCHYHGGGPNRIVPRKTVASVGFQCLLVLVVEVS